MDLVTLLYRGLFDSLATIDLSGGVLLAAIWFQTGYVALFRAIHGEEARREASGGPPRPTAARPAPAKPVSPWDLR